MHRHKEMVDARLGDLNDSVIGNMMFLLGYVSTMDGITSDLKRKWQDSFTQAETNLKDNADFSAAKHCRMELLLQNGANTGDAALKRWQSSKQVLLDMGSQHATTIALHARSISESHYAMLRLNLRELQSRRMLKRVAKILFIALTDYEPIGLTPVMCEPVIPSKSTIESLRTMPMETLREELRENHSFIVGKEVKIQAPRSPLSQIN